MQLLIGTPWWFVLFCFLAGAGYAWLLYGSKSGRIQKLSMALLRFFSTAMLCFFLLGPVVIRSSSEEMKPRILMVLDNSESIRSSSGFSYYSKDFLERWRSAESGLGERYDVEYLTLGSEIKSAGKTDFNAKRTDISALFDYIRQTYARQNIGAVVLASDGIYNRGNNPVYKKLNHRIPLYTLGMGDTSVKKDVFIRDVIHNAIAYLNNAFPVELNIAASECKGESSILKITSGDKILHSETLKFESDDAFRTIAISPEATEPGTMHIVATLSRVDGEASVVNNRKDIFIDILDSREKVLLVYNSPHPDIGAIRDALSLNKNYELMTVASEKVDLSELKNQSVVILHGLPGKATRSRELLEAVRKLNIPVWCIVTTQTAAEQLQTVAPGARIDRNGGRFNESQAVYHPSFTAFTLNEATKSTLDAMPPLKAPFGNYAATSGMEVMAWQKIGSVTASMPLWAFSDHNGEKTALLFGEGFWRWRIYDFIRNGSHEASNELVSKTIQYLSVKEDKRKFRVYPVQNVFEEDENIRFTAEIYNASYEAVNSADVTLRLTNAEKKTYDFTFSKSGNAYRLDAGMLPPGPYQYTASASGLTETIKGKILVTPLQMEAVNTRADHGLLRQMAALNGGKFWNASEIGTALDHLKENESISTITHTEKRPDELINVKWVFFLLLLLISAEWFWRKYEGGI